MNNTAWNSHLFSSDIDETLRLIVEGDPTRAEFEQEYRAFEELLIREGSSITDNGFTIQFIPDEREEFARLGYRRK